MNKIIVLSGSDYPGDKDAIEKNVPTGAWFVLDTQDVSLNEYITYLHEDYELPNRIGNRLKICGNISWQPGDVTLLDSMNNASKPANIIELLANLPQNGEQEGQKRPLARIIIENDSRPLLANIAQQLIYLSYPLAEIDIIRRKEFQDAESVRKLINAIGPLSQAAREAFGRIEAINIPVISQKDEIQACKEQALAAYRDIGSQLEKAEKVEMNVAVAASKKTGKSVIVNCMLGQELAPTSLEMATPNSCVYRMSRDGKYHLIWDRNNEIYERELDEWEANGRNGSFRFEDKSFQTAQELYKFIDKAFKQAQKDTENRFLIPDMIVEYISNRNNFESYTIHDTPGPDAAGTAHKESAEKAMDLCDASIFAIDYAKYLTENEVEYLKQVRDIFEKKQKFHTLLFDINKLDLALQDSGAKSRVKSIDFIRNRLKAIDSKYEDCIIFATSALDYFNVITLEQAAADFPQIAPLLEEDADWEILLDDILDKLEEANAPEYLITAISNISSETGKLRRQLGYKKTDAQTFKDYTGIPQLMSYLRYILENKAREEIVNFIAVTIDALASSINNIVNRGENLLQALDWNNEKIESIRKILDDYVRAVKKILDPRIKDQELAQLSPRHAVYFENLFNELNNKTESVSLEAIVRLARARLERTAQREDIKGNIWKRYQRAQIRHLEELRGAGAIRPVRLALENKDFKEICRHYLEEFSRNIRDREQIYLNYMAESLQTILENRFLKVRKITDECRRTLEKENCHIKLPEMPSFSVDVSKPDLPDLSPNLSDMALKMNDKFKKLEWMGVIIENFKRHKLNILNYENLTGFVNLSDYSIEEIENIVKGQEADFLNFIDQSGLVENFAKILDDIQKDSGKNQDLLLRNFYSLVGICENSVTEFGKLVDDRDKYAANSNELRIYLEVINRIQNASRPFLSIWQNIKPENAQAPGDAA